MHHCRSVALVVVAAGAAVAPAVAGPFTSGNLVVLRVGSENPGGSGSIVIEEYSRTGTAVGNSIALPTSGANAVCLPDLTNHDRHLHRSVDGRYLAFAAYGTAPSATDPTGTGAADVPRVVGLVRFDGVIDLSTRLPDSFDFTSIRSAATTDGTALWLSGDNASGATLSGGLRYTTRGSSTSVNLSQVQVFGGAHTPDNIRDAGVFGGQLFDCSGSNASIGKGVFQVGTGLPTSGSQMVSAALNGNDGASASSCVLLDLDPTIAGVDVLYSATSATGEGVHKYVKQPDGTWASRGFTGFAGIDHVAAEATPGGVEIFASSISGVVHMTDTTPLTGSLSGTVGPFIITAPEGFTIGGIDFSPVNQTCYANCDGSTAAPVLNVNDFICFQSKFAAGDSYANCDGSTAPPVLNVNDFICFQTAFATGCP